MYYCTVSDHAQGSQPHEDLLLAQISIYNCKPWNFRVCLQVCCNQGMMVTIVQLAMLGRLADVDRPRGGCNVDVDILQIPVEHSGLAFNSSSRIFTLHTMILTKCHKADTHNN